MDITQEWRSFDPNDPRTHPEGSSQVEIEFEDGRIASGQYFRDAGMFTFVGDYRLESTQVKRWRYESRN